MSKAGANIRELAKKHKKEATTYFTLAGILFLLPILTYTISGLTGISVFIWVCCWVSSAIQIKAGLKKLKSGKYSNQGAAGEESTALMFSELEQDGWEIEYNVMLADRWDADAFLCSPKNNCFVVDTKTVGGTIFFDETTLMRRYGAEIYPVNENRDVLKAVKSQAAKLQKMKGVSFVTPILCFTKNNLDIKTINNKVKGVYVLKQISLIRSLRKLDN